MQYLMERFREPSTWRGLVALVTALGVTLSPEQQEAVITAGLAVIGLIGVFAPERRGPNVLLLVCVAGLLSACGATLKDVIPPKPESPAQAVFLAKSEYGVLLKAAVAYESWPRCETTTVRPCSDAAAVAVLRLSQVAARGTLDTAEITVRSKSFGADTMASAAKSAANAVAAFAKIQKDLGVKP